MGRRMDFDEQMRNRLKDFIGGKNWSVSRFASRYVDIYAETYSRMEAPGTSTARKLIEDKSHVFTEKEATVLEKMTGAPLLQLWLENQHRILTEKATSLSDASGSLDSEAIVKWEVRRLAEHPARISEADLSGLLRQYVDADTALPLILIADDAQRCRSLVMETLPDAQRVTAKEFCEKSRDLPFDTVFCFVTDTIDTAEAGRLYREAVETMQKDHALGRSRHVILQYYYLSRDKENVNRAVSDWSKAAMVLPVILPQTDKPSKPQQAGIKRDFREHCLKRMRTLPELFKREIMAVPKFPLFATAGDCSDFIFSLYKEQEEYFKEDSLISRALEYYLEMGLPEAWLDKDYDRESMLVGLLQYLIWNIDKTEELEAAGIDPTSDPMHLEAMEKLGTVVAALFRKTDSLSNDPDEWTNLFEMTYNNLLMESDL